MTDESKRCYEDPHCDDDEDEMDRRISRVAFIVSTKPR